MKTYLYSGLSLLSDGQSRFLDGAGLDEHLQLDNANQSTAFLSDHLGSTGQLVDSANGSAKARYDYKSYGRLEGDIDNPVASNAYTYTGREDDGTGLMYYRARYYDPELEVFISQDPLGDAQRYVGGNPLGFVDPLGLEAFGVTVGVNGFAGIGAGAAGSISYTGAIFINNKGISFAVIPSHGGFIGGPGSGTSAVPQGYNPRKANTYNSQANFAVGAFAGGGLALFHSNANRPSDLCGPFDTNDYAIGVGPAAVTLQHNVDPNSSIHSTSLGLPIPYTGGGLGIGAASYRTITPDVWPITLPQPRK